ncbi:MAG: SDR family oxidoreductase [Candidatus Hodarchaeales archaeon]
MVFLKGKVCLITGANSGIGKATVRGLAELDATIIALCRNRERAEKVLAEIVEKTGNDKIDLVIADLSSQTEIRNIVPEITANYDKLDVLINNAAVYHQKRKLSADGYEMTFAVNHLAPFLLTNLLLDILKRSAPSRIINVSSSWHRGFTIWFDNLQGEKIYKGSSSYRQSKLANILFTYELSRRLKGTGVTVNCLHPGVVRTNINRSMPVLGKVWRYMPLLASAKKGAETSIYLASSPEVEGVTGKYYHGKKIAESSPESHDIDLQRKLWDVSLSLTAVIL